MPPTPQKPYVLHHTTFFSTSLWLSLTTHSPLSPYSQPYITLQLFTHVHTVTRYFQYLVSINVLCMHVCMHVFCNSIFSDYLSFSLAFSLSLSLSFFVSQYFLNLRLFFCALSEISNTYQQQWKKNFFFANICLSITQNVFTFFEFIKHYILNIINY